MTVALDVLVIGSGIAGLTAALDVARLAPGARVVLVTKTALGEGSTAWAQGGIAAVVPDDPSDERGFDAHSDSVALHVADTLAAGVGACVADAVRLLCEGAPDAIAALRHRGLVLDRDGVASGSAGRLARGLEAAHSRRRVLHAGGDVTGARVAAALVAAVRASEVVVLEHTALVDLTSPGSVVTGARLLGPSGPVQVSAAAVVLATGGFGQLFAHTTNPVVATGDGLAAAARAGALVTDAEMVQFHPTQAKVGERRFLVSEAVRGEGAVLRDARGRRFLAHGPLAVPGAELAPRDVVARAIAAAMAEQGGSPVLLDATGLAGGCAGLAQRFPGIDALCRAAGLDWAREGVPVTPAAHYAMGGVRTDVRGRTSLPGLWAVGEVAWTGVHGANRLASNSLLEAAVFAARAASDVVAVLGARAPAQEGQEEVPDDVLDVAVSGGALERAELAALMWDHAGLVRDETGLELAAKSLATPTLLSAAPEDANLTQVARLLVASARHRTESRGAHWRSDHPGTDPVARHTTVRAVLTRAGASA